VAVAFCTRYPPSRRAAHTPEPAASTPEPLRANKGQRPLYGQHPVAGPHPSQPARSARPQGDRKKVTDCPQPWSGVAAVFQHPAACQASPYRSRFIHRVGSPGDETHIMRCRVSRAISSLGGLAFHSFSHALPPYGRIVCFQAFDVSVTCFCTTGKAVERPVPLRRPGGE
jgi:hypothetical protein